MPNSIWLINVEGRIKSSAKTIVTAIFTEQLLSIIPQSAVADHWHNLKIILLIYFLKMYYL